jgi:rSAM/selenodomain-associated transferase 1
MQLSILKQALAVMVKAPIPGRVKTRLCPPLTPEMAAELYRCFLIDIFKRVAQLPRVNKIIGYTPEGTQATFRNLLPSRDFEFIPQRGQDLGERMANLFEDLFRSGYTSISLIGSDCPHLLLEFLQKSLDYLKNPDVEVVLGPSEDGGYYLVGLSRPQPEIFQGIPWSTDKVLTETLNRIHQLGLKVALLSPWYDIDTLEDLKKLAKEELKQPGKDLPLETLGFLRKHLKI